MKTYRFELMVNTDEREQFLNLSYEVEECVRRSHVFDGICVVCSQHTTSAIFLENDREGLYEDWKKLLNKLVPAESSYKVDYISAGAAHMKQMLLGSSVTVPVSDGRLDLGQHQFIMYGDFDGCRDKTVLVKIIGE
jgi:secondary thiamine-phosphate synthase enzyme